MRSAYVTVAETHPVPFGFIKKRIHSLTGFFLVLFLFEHLLTNSEAVFFIGDDGEGFIRSVNFLHSLPYLQVIEICLLGLPFAIHGIIGVQYLFSCAINSFPRGGAKPALQRFSRNNWYTLQRITGAILVLGLCAHVYQMRFHQYPYEAKVHGKVQYAVPVSMDKGLYTLAPRLNVQLFEKGALANFHMELKELRSRLPEAPTTDGKASFSHDAARTMSKIQEMKDDIAWLETLTNITLGDDDVIAVVDSFGLAVLLSVRDTFKSIPIAILYSLFVLAGAFHAANGLWTFCITWGITKNEQGRMLVRYVSSALMSFFAFLGLAAIWGVYWINLKE